MKGKKAKKKTKKRPSLIAFTPRPEEIPLLESIIDSSSGTVTTFNEAIHFVLRKLIEHGKYQSPDWKH